MKKVINYKVEGTEWENAQTKAFEKLNKKAKIDGFRPGKAPRNIFERTYGKTEIYSEAAETLIQKRYESIITEEKIIPVVRPKIDFVKLDGETFEANITLVLKPEVTLGAYKNLDVKKEEIEITEEEIEKQINYLLEDYAEIVEKDGKIENGDIAIIDYKGLKDGVAFDGGTAENYQLEIGSNTFIPGFEEGLIGMNKNEEKDLELTFPEDYAAEELKGQKVIFQVKVNDIKQRIIPEMNQEFFEDLAMEDVDSKEKLENQIKERLTEKRQKEADKKYVEELLEKAASNMTVEIDEEIIEQEAHQMYHEFIDNLRAQGISEEIYLKYFQTNEEKMISEMTNEAEKKVKFAYLLEELIKVENLTITDQELEEKIQEVCQQNNITKEELLKYPNFNIEDFEYNLQMEKAIDFLKNNN